MIPAPGTRRLSHCHNHFGSVQGGKYTAIHQSQYCSLLNHVTYSFSLLGKSVCMFMCTEKTRSQDSRLVVLVTAGESMTNAFFFILRRLGKALARLTAVSKASATTMVL